MVEQGDFLLAAVVELGLQVMQDAPQLFNVLVFVMQSLAQAGDRLLGQPWGVPERSGSG